MNYLIIEEILQIHDRIIKKFGGEQGIVDRGELDFIVNKVQSSKTDVYHKAAMLLFEIITTHPFIDGNKRTAFEAAEAFLWKNGKSLKLKDIKQDEEYIYSIAEGKKNIFSIINWVKTHSD